MKPDEHRRQFLKLGSLAAAGGLLAGKSAAQKPPSSVGPSVPMGGSHAGHGSAPQPQIPADSDVKAEYDGFSRFMETEVLPSQRLCSRGTAMG